MNFLSHFYFHQADSHHYNCGLVLPDLVKNFCQSRLTLQKDYQNETKNALKFGSEQHQEADRVFHNSDYFNTATQAFASLTNQNAQWPRKWFLNHLLVEILLDRVLMDNNHGLCASFYDNLSKVQMPETIEFIQESGVVNSNSFEEKYKRFVNFPFIFDYQHNEKIIFALSRVYQKVGINYQWTESDKALLLKNLPKMIEITKDLLPNLNEILKN
jgi:hypothetical protein